MLAVLTQLSGLTPAFSFNLGLATWFALVVVSAFSVGYNLVALLPGASTRSLRNSVLAGLLAAVAVLIGALGSAIVASHFTTRSRTCG